jgi:hypothetical protein
MNEAVMNPCPTDIERACEQFDADNKVLEAALGELFRQFPRNTDPAHVFLKVTALNALYGTQIPRLQCPDSHHFGGRQPHCWSRN